MRSRVLAGCAIGALSFIVACARSSAPDQARPDGHVGSTTSAIQGGTADGNAHPFAVGVCIGQKGRCDGICSGALILPNVVVTARHCVQQTTEQIDCATSTFGGALETNYITTGDWLLETPAGAKWHSVKQILVPPDDAVCGNDIALIVLDDVLASSEAKPITPGVQYSMSDSRYDRAYTAIGFGRVSENDSTSNACRPSANTPTTSDCAGVRRIRKNIGVLCIPGDPQIDCPDIKDQNGTSQYTPKEFLADEGVCAGDSGSSAYEQGTFNAGAPVSFGVLSRGGADVKDPTKCGPAFYTRLDKYRDFVVNTAEQASASWTLYPKPVPDWTVYVPPPVVDAGADSGKAPTTLPEGATCTDDADCTSALCRDTGSGLACTVACDPAGENTCTDGYVCRSEGFCAVPVPTTSTPQSTTTTSGGCSLASSSSTGTRTNGMLGLGIAALVTLNVRRAVRRRRSA